MFDANGIQNFHTLPNNEPLSNNRIFRTPFIGNVNLHPPPLPLPLEQHRHISPEGKYEALNGFDLGYAPNLSNGSGYAYGSGLSTNYNPYGFYSRNSNVARRYEHPNEHEIRFIQLAETSSRPAFESIEKFVFTIGNVATMLDSTYFALTSSFQAILKVAASFWHMRRVFKDFWKTFFICHNLMWIYKRVFSWMRVSSKDPLNIMFKEAFIEALNPNEVKSKVSQEKSFPWTVLAFLSIVFTSPYLLIKLFGSKTNKEIEISRDPQEWINPTETVALYNFQARNPLELTIHEGQRIYLAPRGIQNTYHLLSTGWALASVDKKTSGLVPITYLKTPRQDFKPFSRNMWENENYESGSRDQTLETQFDASLFKA